MDKSDNLVSPVINPKYQAIADKLKTNRDQIIKLVEESFNLIPNAKLKGRSKDNWYSYIRDSISSKRNGYFLTLDMTIQEIINIKE